MALRKIIKTDEEKLLRRKSKEVNVFDDRLCWLIKDMEETMHNEDGVGLAAPQIGILKRVVICHIDGRDMEFINPKIISSSGAVTDIEGCLSVPGKRGNVTRPAELTVVAQDRKGKWFKLEGREYAARVICHEIDHLDGILYTDKAVKVMNV